MKHSYHARVGENLHEALLRQTATLELGARQRGEVALYLVVHVAVQGLHQ